MNLLVYKRHVRLTTLTGQGRTGGVEICSRARMLLFIQVNQCNVFQLRFKNSP